MSSDNRYSHGKIYKLIEITTGVFYIGHTALNRIDQRYQMHKHASKCQNYKNSKVYSYLTYEKFTNGDIKIILIEEVNVKNKRELERVETEHICKEIGNPLCLNTKRPYLSDEQVNEEKKKYNYENRERISAHKKEAYEQNKEEILEKCKQYRLDNKDKLAIFHKQYREQNREKLLEQKKQYWFDNKEEINDKRREHYVDNKEKILEKQKEKCTCICGLTLRKQDLRRHERSQKHIKFIEEQKEENSIN